MAAGQRRRATGRASPLRKVALEVDRVVEGDCVAFMQSLPDECVDLLFADPPYNLNLTGELVRPNATRVDGVTDAWDSFGSFAEYDTFTRTWLREAQRILKPTGSLWVIGTYHNIHRVGTVLMDLGYWLLNDVTWVKSNPMPQMKGVRFCNATETLIWAKKSVSAAGPRLNYRGIKAGGEDLQMRSDWYFPICSGRERLRTGGRKAHSTQKPEALLHRVIASCSRRGDLVFDPFCGTGTTAAVARRLGRRWLTVDACAEYVSIARRRLAAPLPVAAESGADDAEWVDAPPPRVPFLTLVEGGKLPPGTTLRLQKRGPLARVNEDGSVTCGALRGSIHAVGRRVLQVAACNGWDQWWYEDEGGEWKPLNVLRTGQAGGGAGSRSALG